MSGLSHHLLKATPTLRGHMMQTEVLTPWLRLSVDTFRLGLQVQSNFMSLLNNGRVLIPPADHAPEPPTPLASALAGTPYAPEVVQAVTDEISSETRAARPKAVRVKSRPPAQRAAQGRAHKAAKRSAKKPSGRKAPA
jgi:hypothetical protein